MRRSRIYVFGKRSERDAALPQFGQDREQMRQGTPEPIKLPDDQRIAGLQIFETISQIGTVLASAGRLVGKKMPAIDAGCIQRIALKINRLPVVGGRYTHVANEHVGKPLLACCRTASFPTGFSGCYGV